MIAALYCRVSTEEQAQEGFSIAAQIHQLTEYCKKNNIEIFRPYIDEGISGQKENRPQFQAMITDAEQGLFKMILVHKFDRFARNTELSQRVKNRLKKSGVNVVSITEPLEDSPMGFFVGGLHDLLSEYYVRNLSNEVKKGMVERASQGLHTGKMPYGYIVENGTVFINDQQADVVRMVYDLYNEKGWGYGRIAKLLNQNNVPTHFPGTWRHSQIRYMLRNVKYIGKVYYSGTTYEGTIPPIIDEYTFIKAQRPSGQTFNRGKHYNTFLLLGLLKCHSCHASMRVKKLRDRKGLAYYMYTCGAANQTIDTCKNNAHLRVEKLEDEILQFILNTMNRNIEDFTAPKMDMTNIVDVRKAKIRRDLEKAKQAFYADIFTAEEYKIEKDKLASELEELDKLLVGETEEQSREKFREVIKNKWEKYEKETTVAGKKGVLQEFIKCIYVNKEHFYVEYYNPKSVQ